MNVQKYPPLSGFLRLNQVLELIPISKSTWWAGVSSGKYPQPVKISKNITGWRVIDIKNLIDTINAGNTTETIKKTDAYTEWLYDNIGIPE